MSLPLLMEFEGQWGIARRIDDRLMGRAAVFTGRALFRPDGVGLEYTEEGMLKVPGQPEMQATRRYLWRAQGAEICVLFEDGRAFHRLSADRLQDTHDCAPDIYHVLYQFDAWPNWRADWRVSGPRKDYRMISDYTRA